MAKTLSRQMIDSLYPEGAAWLPARNGYMDRLRDGQAANWETLIEKGSGLADTRNPQKVPAELLPDLEKDFGVNPRSYLTLQSRRNALMSKVYMLNSAATYSKLQTKLDRAGFGKDGYGAIVIPNQSPAANPDALIALYPYAYYLANEIRFSSNIQYEGCGDMICNEYNACCGFYEGFEGNITEFFTPPSKYWSAIFFIGKSIKRRNEDGSIAEIEGLSMPNFRRNELHKLILETKPMGTWALIFATYSQFG